MSKARKLLGDILASRDLIEDGFNMDNLWSRVEELLSKPEKIKQPKPEANISSIEFSNAYERLIEDSNIALEQELRSESIDRFAGLAMQGFIAADKKFQLESSDIADWSYEQAYEMMEAKSLYELSEFQANELMQDIDDEI